MPLSSIPNTTGSEGVQDLLCFTEPCPLRPRSAWSVCAKPNLNDYIRAVILGRAVVLLLAVYLLHDLAERECRRGLHGLEGWAGDPVVGCAPSPKGMC